MRTKAVLFTGPNCVEVDEVEVPSPGKGEVLIETLYSVASPGTDLRCLSGQQPGTEPWPNIPGYSIVGRVVEGDGIDEGRLVFCTGTRKASVAIQWGGHIGHAVVNATDAHLVPIDLEPTNAVLAHLAAIALRGVLLTNPTVYDTVAVIGLGPIGQLSARLFAANGARVVAVDLDPNRVVAAQNGGLRAIQADGDPVKAIRSAFEHGADIVVDATGSPATLATAVRAAKDRPWGDVCLPGAKVVIQGSYVADVPLPYGDAFMREVSFYVPRDCQPSDIRLVLDLMTENRLRCGDLISRIYSPDEAPRAYASLLNREPNVLTVAFQWS